MRSCRFEIRSEIEGERAEVLHAMQRDHVGIVVVVGKLRFSRRDSRVPCVGAIPVGRADAAA